MNETIAGIILMVVVFGGSLLLWDSEGTNYGASPDYRPGSAGHPLWSD